MPWAGDGMEYKAIYCNAEPPIVNPAHDKKNIYKLLNYYPYIMTWNMDLIDEKRFFKKNIPYVFQMKFGETPFEKRKWEHLSARGKNGKEKPLLHGLLASM